jgi:hypothetical protein
MVRIRFARFCPGVGLLLRQPDESDSQLKPNADVLEWLKGMAGTRGLEPEQPVPRSRGRGYAHIAIRPAHELAEVRQRNLD